MDSTNILRICILNVVLR